MASAPHGRAQILPTDDETPFSTPKFRPNSLRNSSFSSSSRSNSSNSSSESLPFFFNNSSPPHSPTTPLNLKGIPFSWEQTPGNPKIRHGFKKTESSGGHRLPLTPAGAATSAAKKHPTRFKRDPFFAAREGTPNIDGKISKGEVVLLCRIAPRQIESQGGSCDWNRAISVGPGYHTTESQASLIFHLIYHT